MVHRDIKPANLLIQQEQGGVQVKILDFGLARLNQAEKSAGRTILAKDNTVMGTPDYVSPEQSRDLHETDIRSDIYSLGCTFYYLLAGEVPFPEGNTVDKLIRHNTEHAERVDERRRDVPKPVADIVAKMMAKNPAERFQTPDELMEALAPHAAPSVAAWPIAPPGVGSDRLSQEEIVLGEDKQIDTEPRAESATQVNEQDSILEWADQSRKQRKLRRSLLAALLFAAGVVALGSAVGIVWICTN
jgi:serine/threonine-protein kinase